MSDKDKKITNEKPVKIPLPFVDALKGLINTNPPKKQETKEKKTS